MSNLGLYAKAIAAAIVAALVAAITALDDGTITLVEWTVIAVALLTGLAAVWAIPNLPDGIRRYAKAITAGLVAGVAALGVALTDGVVSPAEWLTIFIALGTGAGLVSVTPNALSSDLYGDGEAQG